MRSVRTILSHCKIDAPVVDAFQCSQCEWSYAMRTQKPYLIAYKDAERACREFDEHRCEDFEPRKTDGTAHQCSDLGRKLTPHQRYLLELGFTMDNRENDASQRQPTPKNRRQGAIRGGEEHRKIKIPPPPGSPVRSGLDRRAGDRRTGSLQAR